MFWSFCCFLSFISFMCATASSCRQMHLHFEKIVAGWWDRNGFASQQGFDHQYLCGMRYRQVPFHWRSNSSGETSTFLQIKSFQTNCESPNYINFWSQTYLTCIFNFIWHIKRDSIAKLVVLPLYPQFSITTTGSSLHVLQNIFRCYICINFLFSFCST